MAYTEAVLRRALDRLEEDRRRKREEYEAHLAHAYELRPRLREIDRELRQTMAQTISVCLARGQDPKAAIAEIRARNLRLQDERQWILDEAELPDGYLDDTPICSLCNGSGYVGARMCECLRELCRQEQKRELAALLPTGKERFENFSLRYYPDKSDPSLGASPRKIMQMNLQLCKTYAAEFHPGSGSLLMSGATGLGKTFLSACIARQVADAGYSVTYVSAGKLFSDYEAVKFGGAAPETLRRYEDCDLLIVDDLGTEVTTQFVISTLYTVVNDRMLERKAMIASTNLRPEDIEARYGPQLASRFLGAFKLVAFAGSDIRLQLK